MQLGAEIPVSVVGAATSVGAIELLLAHLSNTTIQSLADVSAAARALHEGPHHYNSQLPITTLRAVSAGCPFSSPPSL